VKLVDEAFQHQVVPEDTAVENQDVLAFPVLQFLDLLSGVRAIDNSGGFFPGLRLPGVPYVST
jgi:hypothetical protein